MEEEVFYPYVEVTDSNWPTHNGWCYEEWEVSEDKDGTPSYDYHFVRQEYDDEEGYSSHGVEPDIYRRWSIAPDKEGLWLYTHFHDEWGEDKFCLMQWYRAVKVGGALYWRLEKEEEVSRGWLYRRLYTDNGLVETRERSYY